MVEENRGGHRGEAYYDCNLSMGAYGSGVSMGAIVGIASTVHVCTVVGLSIGDFTQITVDL